MSWDRQFSTETFPGPFHGFRQVSRSEAIAALSPVKVFIQHGGGGPNSHMAMEIDGWHLESNGSYGTCGGPNNADGHGYAIDNSLWNDWWIYDGGITEDVGEYRQSFGYPRVLDYAGGRISGAALKDAGVVAVCRYLSDGGAALPGKLLIQDEVDDLHANGIGIAPNWETTADFMLRGYAGGAADASKARQVCDRLGFPSNQIIYFSADFDATPQQQNKIDDYLRGVSSVIGFDNTGIYGGYWPVIRSLNNGTATRGWQTEAWSSLNPGNGINIDSRVVLVQRNVTQSQGQPLDGVPTDINDLHGDLGAWVGDNAAPPPPAQSPPPVIPSDPFISWYKQASTQELLEYVVAQLGPGDPHWRSKGSTLRDFVWGLKDPSPAVSRLARPLPSHEPLMAAVTPTVHQRHQHEAAGEAPVPSQAGAPVASLTPTSLGPYVRPASQPSLEETAKKAALDAITEFVIEFNAAKPSLPDPPTVNDFTKADARSRAAHTLLIGSGMSAVWGLISALGDLDNINWFDKNAGASVVTLIVATVVSTVASYVGRMARQPAHHDEVAPFLPSSAPAGDKPRHRKGE